jgi:integrase
VLSSATFLPGPLPKSAHELAVRSFHAWRRHFRNNRHGHTEQNPAATLTCATLLLAQGVHPRVVMEILGHSQTSITMNLYSHVIPAMQREVASPAG